MTQDTSTTEQVRRYVELEYTLDADLSRITVGLHTANREKDAQVNLFLADAGIVAAVTVEIEEESTLAEALDEAEEMAYDEIDRWLDEDDDLPDPWTARVVDHDGMAENVRRWGHMLPSRPVAPVASSTEV